MDPLIIAIIVAVFTLIVLFSGIPIAFGLSFVSIALLVAFEGFQMLDVFAETFYAGCNAAVQPRGQDLSPADTHGCPTGASVSIAPLVGVESNMTGLATLMVASPRPAALSAR